jgi:hypothetical protein
MLIMSICVQNSFLSTAKKKLHLNLISKLILRFALLPTKHNKEYCHVKILISYSCRLSSPSCSSSKTLSKHILSTPMFRFCFQSIRGTVGICEIACRAILKLPFIQMYYLWANGLAYESNPDWLYIKHMYHALFFLLS